MTRCQFHIQIVLYSWCFYYHILIEDKINKQDSWVTKLCLWNSRSSNATYYYTLCVIFLSPVDEKKSHVEIIIVKLTLSAKYAMIEEGAAPGENISDIHQKSVFIMQFF